MSFVIADASFISLMNDQKVEKILEKSPMSGIAVPIAIVLVGALIIFGVTKMLSTGKSYKDLIEELHSKTFGNRWVAAYELSKFIASNSIPKEEIPWLIENLSNIFKETPDTKTKNFIILALNSLNDVSVIDTLNLGLLETDKEIQLNSVVGIANLKLDDKINWVKIEELLSKHDDAGLQQAIIMCIAQHKRDNGILLIKPFLSSSNLFLKYSAATALATYNDESSLPVLEEIFKLEMTNDNFNEAQIESLKLNVITAVQKSNFIAAKKILENFGLTDKNIRISTRAQEVLNLLKN